MGSPVFVTVPSWGPGSLLLFHHGGPGCVLLFHHGGPECVLLFHHGVLGLCYCSIMGVWVFVTVPSWGSGSLLLFHHAGWVDFIICHMIEFHLLYLLLLPGGQGDVYRPLNIPHHEAQSPFRCGLCLRMCLGS